MTASHDHDLTRHVVWPHELSADGMFAFPLPVRTIDYHTGGEPFRIVVSDLPATPGDSVLERRRLAPTGPLDEVRLLLCNEPRGHADMYGCFFVPPDDDGAIAGVLFWHKDGFSTACGHGTIALGTYAVDSGLVAAPDDGQVDVVIDVPSGRVIARVRRVGGRTVSVAFLNVPSFVIARDLEVSTSRGPVAVDVSFGGALYGSVRAADLGLAVEPQHVNELIAVGREIKAALLAHPQVSHPTDDRLSDAYGTIWFDELEKAPLDDSGSVWQRNCTVFADGEVDRSPCGSGTSARLALLHDSGRLATGQTLIHDSIVGSRFSARVVEVVDGPGRPAVLTEIEGNAHRTGEHSFTIDPADAIGLGFQLR
jgi:proline racemase